MVHLNDFDATLAPFPTAGLHVISPDKGAGRTPAQEQKAALRHLRRVERRRFAKLEQHRRAVEQLSPLPVPGESLHICTSGAYSGSILCDAIIQILPTPIDELIVSTLGTNRDAISALCQAFDEGAVKSMTVILSDYFRHSDKRIFKDCQRDIQARRQTIRVTRSHAKVMLFRGAGRHIVLEGSMNLRSSQNWEQAVVCDDASLYQFHKEWLLALPTTEVFT